MSFTLSKGMRQATGSRSAPTSRQAASVRCMALPDAKAIARKALLGAGALATAFTLTMSPAQAFDLPFFNKNPAEKVSNAANDLKNKVQSNTNSAVQKVKANTSGSPVKPFAPPQEANNASAPVTPFTNTGPNINSATKQTADAAINAVGDVGTGLQNSATQAADKLKSAANETALGNMGSDIQKSAAQTADKVKSAANQTSNKVQQSVKGKDMAALTGVNVNPGSAAAEARSTASGTANAVSGAAGDLLSKIQSAVGASPVDQAKTAANNTANKVQGSADSAQAKIQGALGGAQLPNLKTPDLGNLGSDVSSKVQAAGERLGDALNTKVLKDSKVPASTDAAKVATGPDGRTKFL